MNLIERIKSLRIGQSLRLKTETERQAMLRTAKVLGVRIVTKASKRGGFTVARLPE